MAVPFRLGIAFAPSHLALYALEFHGCQPHFRSN
jgi:hypothetical protein